MPWGWGFTSVGSGGSDDAEFSYTVSVPSGPSYSSRRCGLARAVWRRYSSTDCRPRRYRASISICTSVPWGCSQSTSLSRTISGRFFAVLIWIS